VAIANRIILPTKNLQQEQLRILQLTKPVIVNSTPSGISPSLSLSLSHSNKMCILQNSQPQYIWTPSGFGKFSISSAYLTLIQSYQPVCCPNTTLAFWKSLWKLNLIDRLINFLWKIAWNIIPTKARLHAIFPSSILTECPLCKSAMDSL